MPDFNPGSAASLNEAVKLRYEANPDTNAFTDAAEAKLAGIAAGATANAADADLRDRATHTGSQAIATVTGLQAALTIGAMAGHAIIKPSSGLFIANGTTGGLGTVAGVADRVHLGPYVLPWDLSIDQVGISVSTLIASALAKVVIYGSDADGRPSALIGESGTIDCSTTGTKMVSLSASLTRGLYWLGVRSSSTATYRTLTTTAAVPLAWTNAATPVAQYSLVATLAFATGAQPWSFSSGQFNAAQAPLVLMRAL